MPFSKASGRDGDGGLVRYGNKEAQKVVVFRGKNREGGELTLQDIVHDLVRTNENPEKPILLIPFCCNARGANDASISCEVYGGLKLEGLLQKQLI